MRAGKGEGREGWGWVGREAGFGCTGQGAAFWVLAGWTGTTSRGQLGATGGVELEDRCMSSGGCREGEERGRRKEQAQAWNGKATERANWDKCRRGEGGEKALAGGLRK